MLHISGKIAGKSVRQSRDGKEYVTLKFTHLTEDGDLDYIEVRLPEGIDHSALKNGVDVNLPVTARAYENRVFYRVKEGHTPSPAKPMTASAPSAAPAAASIRNAS